MSNFVQLHLHSHLGSQLDGVSDPKEYAKLAKKFGHKSLALTDHGRMNGFFRHQEACDEAGIKPIFGVEAYVSFKLYNTEKKAGKEKRIRNKNMHLIILAKNEIGYKNLLKLNYISNADTDHYYYRNHITLKEIFENKEGLIINSGCGNSPFNTLFREGRIKESEALYKKFCDEFGDDFHTEIHMSELYGEDHLDYDQKLMNENMIMLARKYNKKIFLAGDVHYAEKGLDLVQTLSIAIRNGDTVDNLKFQIESKNLYYHDVSDYKEFNERWGYGYTEEQIDEWCSNSVYIADKCNYRIPERTKMHLPDYCENDDAEIIKKARSGLAYKLNVDEFSDVPKEYKDRLSTELEVIIRKGFSNYILILEDVFEFAKKEKVMRGPARGSGAGSLVLYALDITTIDPIVYNLIFERFLSESRTPDVVFDYFK